MKKRKYLETDFIKFLKEKYSENEEEEKYVQEEENLDIEKFLFRYTHPHILKCYMHLH